MGLTFWLDFEVDKATIHVLFKVFLFQEYKLYIQIKMPFFATILGEWGFDRVFYADYYVKSHFCQKSILYPKNRFFEKNDPKGRLKYSSRDGGTKFFFCRI